MIALYKPEYKDLWFRKLMLEDEETMSYNRAWGGTINFPEEDWEPWYDFWLKNPGRNRFYRYIKNENDDFIGEIAYHFDDELNGYIANVIVYTKYRHMGYGSEALDMLCAVAKENGVSFLYDDIAIDNPAITLFLKHSFIEEYRTCDKIILKKLL